MFLVFLQLYTELFLSDFVFHLPFTILKPTYTVAYMYTSSY